MEPAIIAEPPCCLFREQLEANCKHARAGEILPDAVASFCLGATLGFSAGFSWRIVNLPTTAYYVHIYGHNLLSCIGGQSMVTASERLVVQLTPKDKREVRRRARALGMSVSEYVRQATTGSPENEDAKLDELLQRTKQAAQESMAMIDDTLAFVKASNERIAALESEGKTAR